MPVDATPVADDNLLAAFRAMREDQNSVEDLVRGYHQFFVVPPETGLRNLERFSLVDSRLGTVVHSDTTGC